MERLIRPPQHNLTKSSRVCNVKLGHPIEIFIKWFTLRIRSVCTLNFGFSEVPPQEGSTSPQFGKARHALFYNELVTEQEAQKQELLLITLLWNGAQ